MTRIRTTRTRNELNESNIASLKWLLMIFFMALGGIASLNEDAHLYSSLILSDSVDAGAGIEATNAISGANQQDNNLRTAPLIVQEKSITPEENEATGKTDKEAGGDEIQKDPIAINQSVAEAETISSEQDLVHIVYCMDIGFVDGIPKFQLDTFRDSIQTAIHFSSPSTRSRLRIWIYYMYRESERLMRNLQRFISSRHGVNVTVAYADPSIVTPNRKVWGYGPDSSLNENHPDMKKLMNPANYLRFYLAEMLPPSAKKFWYLDYDVLVSGDLAELFDSHLNDNNMSMAVASNENMRACSAQKIINLGDARLQSLKAMKPLSKCICSGIMLLHRQRWIEQDRRKRLEWWLAENKREKLWNLGSLPPLMLEFDGEWEDLPSKTVITDNKGQRNVPSLQVAEQKGAVLVHPFKVNLRIEKFRIWLQVCFVDGDLQMASKLVDHYTSMNIHVHSLLVILDNPKSETLNQTLESLYGLGIERIAIVPSSDKVNSRLKEVMSIVNVQDSDWVLNVRPTELYRFPGADAYTFLERIDDLKYSAVLRSTEADSNVTFASDDLTYSSPCDRGGVSLPLDSSRTVASRLGTKPKNWCVYPHYLPTTQQQR